MGKSSLRKLEELADRMEITDLISRSAWLMDEGDVDAWVETWNDDGGIDGTLFIGRGIKGKAGLKKYATQMTKTFAKVDLQMRHLITNIKIELLGDGKAKARFYMLVSLGHPYIAQPLAGNLLSYQAQFVKVDGRWLFSQGNPKPDIYCQVEVR